jgi:hypothetical protein
MKSLGVEKNNVWLANSPIWRDTIYWLARGKLTSHAKMVILFLGFVTFVVAAPDVLPTEYLAVMIVGAILFTLLCFSASYRGSRKIQQKFGGAEVLVFRHVATPVSSLFNALAREGVRVENISKVQFETGKISELLNYMCRDGKELITLFEKSPGAVFVACGLDDTHLTAVEKRERLDMDGEPGEIEFIDTGKYTKSHRNIVTTKNGDYYLWYEDHHEIRDGHHFYPTGAYLFKIDAEAAAIISDDIIHARDTNLAAAA